jgi:hypothetical protein
MMNPPQRVKKSSDLRSLVLWLNHLQTLSPNLAYALLHLACNPFLAAFFFKVTVAG